jgi:hypothetical protein
MFRMGSSEKKITIDLVKEVIEKENYILLSTVYKKSIDKLDLICNQGHTCKISFSKFKAGKRCRECFLQRNKLGYKYVKSFIENEAYTLIDETYEKNSKNLNMICPQGHKVKMIFSNFQKGHRCKYCYGNAKYQYDYVVEYFCQYGYQLISTEYKNATKKLKTICPKGHEYSVSFSEFKNNENRCAICSGNKKHTYEYVKSFIEGESGYELLSKEYVNSGSKLKIKCNHNHVYKTTFNCFKLGHRCNMCASTRKYTYEEVKSFIEKEGYQLLSTEYNHGRALLKTICPKGHNYNARFNKFKSGTRCATCGGTKKYTIEQVRKIFVQSDCELISNEYFNSKSPLMFKCECGELGRTTLDSFSRGIRCRQCMPERKSAAQRLSYSEVREHFHKSGCILLSEKYINNSEILDYICECGNISKIRYADFKFGYRCWECGVSKRANKRRATYDKVFNYYLENNCLLLSESYTNTHEKLRYVCECGEENIATFESFKNGSRCKKCGIDKTAEKRRHDYEYVKSYFEKEGCTLLSENYVNANDQLDYLCICGNKSKITFSSLTRGSKCINCKIVKLSGVNHYNWKGGENSLSNYLRSKLYDWRIKSFKKYNFKCTITNQTKNLQVHHLYSFNKIVVETLIELGLDLYDHYGKYTKDELKTLSDKCLELHDKYGLGVPLTKDIHNEFHNIYGYDNTPEQFNDFIKNKVLSLPA